MMLSKLAVVAGLGPMFAAAAVCAQDPTNGAAAPASSSVPLKRARQGCAARDAESPCRSYPRSLRNVAVAKAQAGGNAQQVFDSVERTLPAFVLAKQPSVSDALSGCAITRRVFVLNQEWCSAVDLGYQEEAFI